MWHLGCEHSHLSEVRDQKEVQFLVTRLTELGHRRVPKVADLVVQRLWEIRTAKSAGSTWEKAAVLSLMPQSIPGSTAMIDTAFVL